MTAISTAPPPVQVEENLPCLRCGYNLRTLAVDSRCPECSMPIASSLNLNLLRYADPSWTSILALAMALMLISAFTELAYVIFYLFVSRSDTLLMIAAPLDPLHSFVNPLFWLAVFLLGRSECTAVVRRFLSRATMRVTALAAIVSAILSDPNGMNLGPAIPAYMTAFGIAHAVELLAIICLYIYLLHLARRSGHAWLLLHTRIAMMAILVALCIWAFLDIVSEWQSADAIDLSTRLFLMPIFGYQLYVFFLFHHTLLKSASLARQYWHFCLPLP